MPTLMYDTDFTGRYDARFLEHLIERAPKDIAEVEEFIKTCEEQLERIAKTGFKTVVEVERRKSYEYPTYGHVCFEVVEKHIPVIEGSEYDAYNYKPVSLYQMQGKEWDMKLRHLSYASKPLAKFTGKERVKAIKFAKDHAAKVNGDAVYGRGY